MMLYKSIFLRLSLMLMLVIPLLAHAGLPRSSSVPGGIAIVSLGKISTSAEKPQAWFGTQEVLVASNKNRWVAVVGLPLDTKPGLQKLNIKVAGKSQTKTFRIKTKKYPVQRITLKDNSKVELAPADEARAIREIATIKQLKLNWRETDNTDLDFMIPAQGRLSGNFGLRRIFNGEPRSPHAGLDVAVARDTPIKACAEGKVLAVDDYFFNGKTIFIDHGNGLISMYCHLNQSDVQPGDTISKGQTIGLSGQTGRASGPHLHWSVVLNGAMVDPALFIQK